MLTLEPATLDDAPAIASLRIAAAADLTKRYGKGHWSSGGTEKGVLYDLKTPLLCVARERKHIVATLRLQTKKPWAIDTKYFTPATKPIYLTNMAVDPALQGRGIGRASIDAARRIVRDWPADVIRLDAYDADAGAAGFYEKCGFREVGRTSYRNTPLVYMELFVSSL